MKRITLAAAAIVAATAAPAAAQMATGNYECWFFSRPQMGLNFTINSQTSYTDVEGKRGALSLGAGNKLTFRGGAHDGSNAVYKALSTPTVSFIGASGSEAAFCELAK